MHGYGDIIKMDEGGDVAANDTRMLQQHVVANSEAILSQTKNRLSGNFAGRLLWS